MTKLRLTTTCKLIGGGHFVGHLTVCRAKPVFKLEQESDERNLYVKSEQNLIKNE